MSTIKKHLASITALKEDINLLGTLLGDVIKQDQGDELFKKIEAIRHAAKQARNNEKHAAQELIALLKHLPEEQLIPVARAFNHFLNLSNIAEQYHVVRSANTKRHLHSFDQLFEKLKKQGLQKEILTKQLKALSIEIVLTAHPTEVTRRTLIKKHEKIFESLKIMDEQNNSVTKQKVTNRLKQLISQLWHTNEFRASKPTPIDEAKGGFATIEHSLWYAVPLFLKELDHTMQRHFQTQLPIDACPIKFSSWIGGDRDGNPFVTAKVTQEIIRLSKWMAADLYLKDVAMLIEELSMTECNSQLTNTVGEVQEPYRTLLKKLRYRLLQTRSFYEHNQNTKLSQDIIRTKQELLEPLMICYNSLLDCSMATIAEGALLDVIRRVHCFGMSLGQLDIRQHADKHIQVISDITQALNIGNYKTWDETQRQSFLLDELQNKRPLIPIHWEPSESSQEVLDTFGLFSQKENDLGPYIISMASNPSDILLVALLLQKTGTQASIPIVPLFETMHDLKNADRCMRALFQIPWYQNYCQNKQMIMIGYSDSAKDAGWLTAAWTQYQTMEQLTKLCNQHNIKLTLFHGRGGTVGRGGGPAHEAILAQPPGSVANNLRVTEQGEMIRFKFGFPDIAIESLKLYATATLEATLNPPSIPLASWREAMNEMSKYAFNAYRATVKENIPFQNYMQTVTPINELSQLPIGSRPTKRITNDNSIENLRAIPWIFAWTQNRLLLPTWLGSQEAFHHLIDQGQLTLLQTMQKKWPFFQAKLAMLAMVLLKTDSAITEFYENTLADSEQQQLGQTLRLQLKNAIKLLLQITQNSILMETEIQTRTLIHMRNPYIDPLNFLQAELMFRIRIIKKTINKDSDKQQLLTIARTEQALIITIAGIAAGMRNTG